MDLRHFPPEALRLDGTRVLGQTSQPASTNLSKECGKSQMGSLEWDGQLATVEDANRVYRLPISVSRGPRGNQTLD